MSSFTTDPPPFTSLQRWCHTVLLFCLPGLRVTTDLLSELNSVSQQCVRSDISCLAEEIAYYYQLKFTEDRTGIWRLEGKELNRRLCLLQWLRRSLHSSPDFVQYYFEPALRQKLSEQDCEKALYDQHNLKTLIHYCGQQFYRQFSHHDVQLLQLCLQYCLCNTRQVRFTRCQLSWLKNKREWLIADQIWHYWQKYHHFSATRNEKPFLALLFSLIHSPTIEQITHDNERRLYSAVKSLTRHYQRVSDISLNNAERLQEQLYTHLAQALDRVLFAIKIDDSLTAEMTTLYPRLLRTTREVLAPFEADFTICFPEEEIGLIAIIFGAWLLHENAMQEKQVLLLTGDNSSAEKELEQQIRELTLLPLNIKYLDVYAWQRDGTPKEISLVISPYATALPLYSPPFIHAELPLTEQQKQAIKTLLES